MVDNATRQPLTLLTGATGYVGGRLLRALEQQGRRVRCLVRRPDHLLGRTAHTTEVIRGDVLDAATLAPAFEGVHTAFYLVHSMGSASPFEASDRRAARIFGHAARAAGVRRIIYLGGLADENGPLSPHLRSRLEVGDILRQSGVPVIELRASIVLGAGSVSFEMIRALVDRLPMMVTPRWVNVLAQPIAIDDLLKYLVATLDQPVTSSRVYEVGGADRMSYADVMRVYARLRARRLIMLRVPVLTPFLSSLWLGLVTPLYARVGRKLIESIVHPTVVTDNAARAEFGIEPIGVEEAIRRALSSDPTHAESRWSDAVSSSGAPVRVQEAALGPRLAWTRTVRVAAPAATVFAPIQRIGGETGWYAYTWLWRVRGFLDLLVGGVGVRRGRPPRSTLRVGDAVDFWRVDAIEPNRRLRLAAEMRLPGRAWLEFEVVGDGDGASSVLRQTATFDPAGIAGRAYWYATYPIHRVVFSAMLHNIARSSLDSTSVRWVPSRTPHQPSAQA